MHVCNIKLEEMVCWYIVNVFKRPFDCAGIWVDTPSVTIQNSMSQIRYGRSPLCSQGADTVGYTHNRTYVGVIYSLVIIVPQFSLRTKVDIPFCVQKLSFCC